MRVEELWRFPVKSLQGERLDRAAVVSDGLAGDRRFAIVDAETGLALTARRVPQLLFASARLVGDDLEITLPDGSVATEDDALSAWLGRPVLLVDGRVKSDAMSAECPVDETEVDWFSYEGGEGAFHDAPIWRVSLISKATLGAWDRRRFRANVVLDGEGEDALVGGDVRLGDAVLHVESPIVRCVMITRPQPDGIERDVDVLRTINRDRGSCIAIGATVRSPGDVRVGHELVPRD
jgi:uncharacterized protein YcbX